ncbi:hypothetical protein [Flavobacterium hercynium]|uniref:Uncharacterized protein n=1 Tax=Flavobacterium hercynium TaxID=387094 RepID=A0A226H4J6_9FLAO|nr:hypothetical protein [Flavobacterium hercynium]OXA88400.1 hypothetical protein B0A66_15800 [Flavobacterium hercynium]SMP30916.1 hypothetical protein SAMN06265346_113143 [Flavobacterium hercynium]
MTAKYLKNDYAIIKVIVMFPLALFVPYVGPIVAIGKGIQSITRKTRRQFWKESQPIKKPDRRYKVGYRIEGYAEVEKHERIPADENILKIYRRKGIAYLTIGVVLITFHMYCYYLV